MSFPIHAVQPSSRDAILDALNRVIIGLDNNEYALFESGWITKAVPAFVAFGKTMAGLPALREQLFDVVGPLDTTHFITNVRLLSESETEAVISSYSLAYHYRAGEGQIPDADKYVSGGQYYVEVSKEEDLWRVKTWTMKVVWVDGNPDVMKPQI